MKLPNYENAVISEEKIINYILNDFHIDGAHKSAFFKKFGFDSNEWILFKEALLKHCSENEVLKEFETNYGIKYILEGNLNTPDKRNPRIRTIWFIANEEIYPKFITAYPI